MTTTSVTPGVLESLLERVEELSRAVAALSACEPSGSTPWLDTEGAAEYLSTSPSAIRKLVQRRAIPVHRVGSRLLFDRRELDELLDRSYAAGDHRGGTATNGPPLT